MKNVIVRNYSAGTAEVWYNGEHICNIGTTRVFAGKYGADYDRELQLLTKVCNLLGHCVKRLNYEENKKYQQEIDSAL